MDSVSGNEGKQSARGAARAAALARATVMIEGRLVLAPQPIAGPVFVLLSGLPGSGKSYLARRLQPAVPAAVIATDWVRRQLYPQRTYSSGESAWVYAVCHALIARLLARGHSVIFDATNLVEQNRRVLYAIAREAGALLVIVRTTAPLEVVRRRLEARSAHPDGNLSEAGLAAYEQLRLTEQQIRPPHLVIDTTGDVDYAVEKVVAACRRPATSGPDSKPAYALAPHTADLALTVRGRTLAELFENAAAGMFAQMVPAEEAPAGVRRAVQVEAGDDEALLVAWLSELLYLRDVHGEAYGRFDVNIAGDGRLQATVEGGPCAAFERPIKAVTYHGLAIVHDDDGYQATIVFDV